MQVQSILDVLQVTPRDVANAAKPIAQGASVDGERLRRIVVIPAAIQIMGERRDQIGVLVAVVAGEGVDHLMLVTDAMPTVGVPSDEFMLQGRAIRREGDRLVSEEGVLAGSTLTMVMAVSNAVQQGRLSLPEAARMASSTPAHFLGLAGQTGAIRVGLSADLIAMTDDFTITRTWIGGAALS